jgi:hypothetical protein
MQERAQDKVFTSKCQHQAQRAQYRRGVGVTCVECVYNMFSEVHEVVEVVGAWDGEIAHGGRFWPAKPKNEPYRLDFGPGCVNPSADRRLSLCGGVHAIVCMLAHKVGEIERGGGFLPAKYETEPCQLGFGPGCANPSASHRVGIWGGVGVAIAVMVRCVRKIARVVAFGLQNQKKRAVRARFWPGVRNSKRRS